MWWKRNGVASKLYFSFSPLWVLWYVAKSRRPGLQPSSLWPWAWWRWRGSWNLCCLVAFVICSCISYRVSLLLKFWSGCVGPSHSVLHSFKSLLELIPFLLSLSLFWVTYSDLSSVHCFSFCCWWKWAPKQSRKKSILEDPCIGGWEVVVRFIGIEIEGCPQVPSVSSLSAPLWKKPSLVIIKPRRKSRV